MRKPKEMTKEIIIVLDGDIDNTVTINTDYDLYNQYNDWAIDMDYDDSYSEEDRSRIEAIRDCHTAVFENMPAGKYALADFEAKAMEFVY